MIRCMLHQAITNRPRLADVSREARAPVDLASAWAGPGSAVDGIHV